MRGIWLEDKRLSLRDDLPRPEPPPGESLVRVLRAGICNTDLELTAGYYPFSGILGHEFVGEVVEGPADRVGKRVVGEINAVCSQCRHCRAGRSTHCERRTVLGIVGRHGCFAEYLTLPHENLLVVPDQVDTDYAVFTEPLAAALRIQDQIPIGHGDRVAVVGDGKLGLLIAQTLALTGADVIAVGRHSAKLQLLAARGIATGDSESLEPRRYDCVVEATGSPTGFATAAAAVRPEGALVLKSTYAGSLTWDASTLVVDEIRVIGSRCGRFAPALELLRQGAVDVESMIHARYGMDEGLRAMAHARQSGVLKVLLAT